MFDKLFKVVEITNDFGLHMRSANKISQIAVNSKKKIWLIKNDKKVDASDIFDILTIFCPKGTKLTIQAEENADICILNKIAELIKNGFGE